MGLVVDTNIFIDAENKRFDLKGLHDYSGYGPVYISAITVSELYAGVHLAKTTDIRIRRTMFVEHIINLIPVIPFNFEAAKIYAELFADAINANTRSGIRVHDLQIAATAIAFKHIVLTRNVKDFKNIPGVEAISI